VTGASDEPTVPSQPSAARNVTAHGFRSARQSMSDAGADLYDGSAASSDDGCQSLFSHATAPAWGTRMGDAQWPEAWYEKVLCSLDTPLPCGQPKPIQRVHPKAASNKMYRAGPMNAYDSARPPKLEDPWPQPWKEICTKLSGCTGMPGDIPRVDAGAAMSSTPPPPDALDSVPEDGEYALDEYGSQHWDSTVGVAGSWYTRPLPTDDKPDDCKFDSRWREQLYGPPVPCAATTDGGSQPCTATAKGGSQPWAAKTADCSDPFAAMAEGDSQPWAATTEGGSQLRAATAEDDSQPWAATAGGGSQPWTATAGGGSQHWAATAKGGSQPWAATAGSRCSWAELSGNPEAYKRWSSYKPMGYERRTVAEHHWITPTVATDIGPMKVHPSSAAAADDDSDELEPDKPEVMAARKAAKDGTLVDLYGHLEPIAIVTHNIYSCPKTGKNVNKWGQLIDKTGQHSRKRGAKGANSSQKWDHDYERVKWEKDKKRIAEWEAERAASRAAAAKAIAPDPLDRFFHDSNADAAEAWRNPWVPW
jgi:hypothetical protein